MGHGVEAVNPSSSLSRVYLHGKEIKFPVSGCACRVCRLMLRSVNPYDPSSLVTQLHGSARQRQHQISSSGADKHSVVALCDESEKQQYGPEPSIRCA